MRASGSLREALAVETPVVSSGASGPITVIATGGERRHQARQGARPNASAPAEVAIIAPDRPGDLAHAPVGASHGEAHSVGDTVPFGVLRISQPRACMQALKRWVRLMLPVGLTPAVAP